jgi:hypothetical protein
MYSHCQELPTAISDELRAKCPKLGGNPEFECDHGGFGHCDGCAIPWNIASNPYFPQSRGVSFLIWLRPE